MTEYPPAENEYVATETNAWAVVSLISGILAWLGLFGLGGIAAVISGYVAKNQIRQSSGKMSGDGLATAGLILGYLNIAMTVVVLCLFFLTIVGVITGAAVCPFFFNGSSY